MPKLAPEERHVSRKNPLWGNPVGVTCYFNISLLRSSCNMNEYFSTNILPLQGLEETKKASIKKTKKKAHLIFLFSSTRFYAI